MKYRLIGKDFAVIALTLCAGSAVFGQVDTRDWVGGNGGGPSTFGRKQNWTSNADPDTDDIARFGTATTTYTSPSVDADQQIGGIIFSGTQSFKMVGASTLTIGASGIVTSSSTPQIIDTKLRLSVSQTWTLNGALTVNGSIDGTGPLIKNGSGTLSLKGANSYTGSTTINGGILSANTLADGLANSSIGASSNAANNLVINGGTLQYTGAATSTNRLFTIGTSGGTIDASGSGAMSFTNSGSIALSGTNTARTLTLTGTNAGQNTFAAAIGDNGTGKTALTKNGTGTWVLSNANTFTGATTVSGGTLTAGATGALGNTSAIQVNNGGTLLLSGSNPNRVSDTATITLGGGQIEIGSGLSESMGALTLTSTSSLNFSGTGSRLTFSSITPGSAGILNIFNWSPNSDHLVFGSAPSNITVKFYSGADTTSGFLGTGSYGPGGEMSAVPEPSTILAGIGLVGFLGWRERRRIGSLLKRNRDAGEFATA